MYKVGIWIQNMIAPSSKPTVNDEQWAPTLATGSSTCLLRVQLESASHHSTHIATHDTIPNKDIERLLLVQVNMTLARSRIGKY
jgi:hypothetical protein